MQYYLMHKDRILARLETGRNDTHCCTVFKNNAAYLPLPLKRLIKDGYKEEFVQKEDAECWVLNEDGLSMLDTWLDDRAVPITRNNYEAYIEKESSPRKWMFQNNGYSFTDCYWLNNEDSPYCWADIIVKKQVKDSYPISYAQNKKYGVHNTTLGGQLEKFWNVTEKSVSLCKKTSVPDDILIAREVWASLIYQKQGFANYCDYRFINHRDGKIAGCICDCFTSTQYEMVTAYDLLEEYNLTQSNHVWEEIIRLSTNAGIPAPIVREQMDMQCLVDYLITNRDRHQNNIGFLRDSDSLRIVKMAPIFDNGSSRHLEGMLPEGILTTTVHGLYSTEAECLKHVKDFCILDASLLPSVNEVCDILSKCSGLSSKRRGEILCLYQDKVAMLKELQRIQKTGADVAQFIQDELEKEQQCVGEGYDSLFVGFSIE